jgi:CheY-like chemotaxis protein
MGFDAAPRLVCWAEDNAGDRRLITMALHDLGGKAPKVRFFGDGAALLDAADQVRPDLLVLDIKMPQLDGIEALRRLRAKPEYAQVPAVFFTSAPQEHERILEAHLGNTRIVSKPINLEDYAAAVRTILQRP